MHLRPKSTFACLLVSRVYRKGNTCNLNTNCAAEGDCFRPISISVLNTFERALTSVNFDVDTLW